VVHAKRSFSRVDLSGWIATSSSEAASVDLSLLEHVSPIEWGNVVLYGQYVLDKKRIRRRRRRPLRLVRKTQRPAEEASGQASQRLGDAQMSADSGVP
jgi:hypothetical protein